MSAQRPDESTSSIVGLSPLIRLERVELTEDIPRVPLELREIRENEFVDLSPEQLDEIKLNLKQVIGSIRYNNFSKIDQLLAVYEGLMRVDPNANLKDAFISLKVDSLKGANEGDSTCVGMSLALKKRLEDIGVHSYLIRFQAGGLLSDAANKYADVGHSALIVPGVDNGEKTLSLLDPGLMIPEPLTFVLGGDSNIVTNGTKQYQVVEGPNIPGYQYRLEIRKAAKDKETGKLLLDKRGNIIYKSSDKIPFDPFNELLNPDECISKDTMRATSGAKITRQTPDGNNLGYLSLNIPEQSVTMQVGDRRFVPNSEGGIYRETFSFEDFKKIENDPKTAEGFTLFCSYMGFDPDVLYEKVSRFVKYSSRYVREIYAPSVREDLIRSGRLSSNMLV